MSHVQNIESSFLFTKHIVFLNHKQYSCLCNGPGSSVGIATDFGLDGSGFRVVIQSGCVVQTQH